MNVRVEDFFLAGMHDKDAQREIIISPLWPVVVAAINAVNDGSDTLRVGPVSHTATLFGRTVNSIDLVTSTGFRVASTWIATTGETNFGVMLSPVAEGVDGNAKVIKSARPAYVARKLKNKDASNTVRDKFITRWGRAKLTPQHYIRSTLRDAMHTLNVSATTKNISINPTAMTALVRFFMGDLERFDLPKNVTDHVETQYKNAMSRNEQVKGNLERVRQLFDKPKWVVFSDVSDGVIVGAVSQHPLVAAIDVFAKTGEVPGNDAFNYAETQVPFKWFKSLDDMDEPYRADIQTQLMMLRLRAGGDVPLLPAKRDIPNTYDKYRESMLDLDAMVHWPERQLSPVLMLDKTV